MRIVSVETFILHVPVTGRLISDSTHTVTHWGAPGVILCTDAGIAGYGYTGTHGELASDRLIATCIRDCLAPILIGRDPREVGALWQAIARHPPLQWVGRGGIVTLAHSAVDVALWDIKAKEAGQPLWHLLGGSADKRVEAYNTDGGWLSLTIDQLCAQTKAAIAAGFGGVKIKVGHADPNVDLERVAAVRAAIGPGPKLMIDGNGRWSLPVAKAFGRRLGSYDIGWFEEPIWYDDVEGHAALARAIDVPIALGEQLYTLDHFRAFITAGAVHYVQPDAVRLAGITEWLQVADLALAARLPVVSHVGDMMQIHLQTAFAHPATALLEYIPWLRECFVEPATVESGLFVAPRLPGAGTTLNAEAMARFGVA